MTQIKVRQSRIRKGLNQRELSQRAGICQSILSDIERGTRQPWPAIAQRLAQALDVEVKTLFPNDWERLSRTD